MLGDDVLREHAGLLGSGHRAQGLTDRHDIVVDRLGQAHHVQVVVVVVEVLREVRGGGVGVVTTDGVQDVDAVLLELVRGDLEGVLALLDQAPLDQIRGVGELDAGVADGGAAVVVQQAGLGTHLLVHHDLLAGQEAPVAVLVGDDLDLGHQLVVPLDQAAHGGGEAGGIATGGEQSDALDGHGRSDPFRVRVKDAQSLPSRIGTSVQRSPRHVPKDRD